MYKSFACLVKFIPKDFILFNTIINRIVFLISFQKLFIVGAYKHNWYLQIDFISCDFVKFIINFNKHVCECMCTHLCIIFFTYKILFMNRDNFTSIFPIWCLLFLFLA